MQNLNNPDEKYRNLFEKSTEGLFVFDGLEKRFVDVNKQFCNITGFTKKQLLRMESLKFFTADERKRVSGYVDERLKKGVLKSKAPLMYEVKYLNPKKEIRVAGIYVLYEIVKGRWLVSLRDVTDKRKMEEALRASETKYKNLLENITDIIYALDHEGRVTFANRPGLDMVGYKKKEVIGQYFIDFIHPEDKDKVLKTHFEKIKIQKRRVNDLHFRLVGKNKDFRWVELNSQSDYEAGIYLGERGVIRDIHDRIETEKKLKESEEKYRKLVDNAGEAVISLNVHGYITFANNAFYDVFGYDPKKIGKIHFSKLIHPDDYNMVADNFNKRIRGEKAMTNYEFRILDQEKNERVVSYTGTIIKKNGKTVEILAIVRDISENRFLLKKIEQSKQHYEKVIDTIQDDICVIDRNFRIQSCNRAFAQKVGLDIRKVKGLLCSEAVPLYDNGLFKDHCAKHNCEKVCNTSKVFKRGEAVSYMEKNIDSTGNMHYHLVNEFPTKDKNGQVTQVVMIFRDVTEQMIAQEKIRRLSDFNKRILDNVPVSIIVLDSKGEIISVNKLALKYMGKSEDQALHRKLTDTENIKSNSVVSKSYKKLYEKGEPFYFYNMPYSPENKSEQMFLNIIAVPLFDGSGKIDGAISMAVNNTEAVQAKNRLEELNKTLERQVKKRTAELDESNKELNKVLDLKSKFISDASHELRTPLTIIQGNLDLAMNEAKIKSSKIPEMFYLMDKEVKHIANILSDLTMITNIDAQSEKINYEKVNLDLLLFDIKQSLNVLAEKKNIKLVLKKAQHKKLEIKGDELKLERLLLNIARNAIKYTRENGTIKMWAEKDKKEARVFVEDNGIGIPEEDLPNIFERFYRVDKARSRDEGGTGLGLAICKMIAELHNGYIGVESKIKKGSTFVLHLPLKGQNNI